jgi:predicted Zn-dependent protease
MHSRGWYPTKEAPTTDISAAKQKFDQAMASSKDKKGKVDPKILAAIGRAETYGGSGVGDAQYGIDRLKEAEATLDADKKADVNLYADIQTSMGINYLKQGGDKGGEAVQAYRKAVDKVPNYARALWRQGMVYLSQDNMDAVNNYFGQAIAADANYGQTYWAYFDYYKDRDVNKAKEYLDKYVATSDGGCDVQYLQADYLFRAGKYEESLQKAQAMENGGCKDFTRLHMLYAFNYNRLHNNAKASEHIKTFFATVPAAQREPSDYALAGSILASVPGSEDSAVAYLAKAYDLDTVAKSKEAYMDSISNILVRQKRYKENLVWVQKSYNLKKEPSNRNIYDLGYAAYLAGKEDPQSYDLAIRQFTTYKTKYPTEPFGYMMLQRIAESQDSTFEKAVQPTNEYITFLSADTVKNKDMLISLHWKMGTYYANTKKDYDGAISEFEKVKSLDPGGATAQQADGVLNQLYSIKNKKNNPPASSKKG